MLYIYIYRTHVEAENIQMKADIAEYNKYWNMCNFRCLNKKERKKKRKKKKKMQKKRSCETVYIEICFLWKYVETENIEICSLWFFF